MSQDQPQRPQPDQPDQPMTYGDVFPVSGDLARKPITTEDAAAMQTAETIALGHTQKGGPAAVMQSAASVNRSRGVVDVASGVKDQSVTVSDPVITGHHIITECVDGQVVGQYAGVDPTSGPRPAPTKPNLVTIGEALETAAISAGEKPVDQSDAAAIQAAEVRTTARMQAVPGGVAAKAERAASKNAQIMRYEDKTKLGDVLADASTLLPKDKVVTREDAEGVIGAEIRNKPVDLATYSGGVAASMAAAAELNQNN